MPKEIAANSKKEVRSMRVSFLFMFSVLMLLAPQVVQAFGVSPIRIDIEEIFINEKTNETLYLTQGNPSKEERLRVTVDKDLQQILGYDEKIITIPIGEQKHPFEVDINTSNVDPGQYEGKIYFGLLSQEEGAKGQKFLEGGQATLSVKVVDKAQDSFTIQGDWVEYRNEQDSLLIKLTGQNRGNRVHSLVSTQVQIFKKGEEGELYSVQKELDLACNPKKNCSEDIIVDLNLDPGSYIARMSINQESFNDIKTDDVEFIVKEEELYLGQKNSVLLYGGITLAGISLVVFILWKRKK